MWILLGLPPILASIVAYIVTKGIDNVKEKIVAFWFIWSGVASTVHLLLGLPPLIALAYPALAFGTGLALIRGVMKLGGKRHHR